MNTALDNIRTIAKREMASYFTSPVAYVFTVIFLLLCAGFTFLFGGFFQRGVASLDSFFVWHPWLYLVLVAAIGMGVWSEERRSGTIELLLTMPITASQAIIGKFLASWAFLALALALTFPLWVTVNYLGNPDNGVILCAYLGSFLMAGAYLAIACMTSAMTRNQVISFILSVVLCLALVLVGVPSVKEFFDSIGESLKIRWLGGFLASLSVLTHSQSFQRGLIDFRDLIFFFSVIGFALFTTGVILRSRRSG